MAPIRQSRPKSGPNVQVKLFLESPPIRSETGFGEYEVAVDVGDGLLVVVVDRFDPCIGGCIGKISQGLVNSIKPPK